MNRRFFLTLMLTSWSCGAPGPAPASPVDPLDLPQPSGIKSKTDAEPVPAHQLQPYKTRSIPGGVACLIRLQTAGVRYRAREQVKGILTPVELLGPLGGISYHAMGSRKLLCDCRLALALLRAAPVLSNLGIREVIYSNTYRYSRMPNGKLSRHALGLAIDVHQVRTGQGLLRVQQDYQRGLDDGCPGQQPTLNRMACLLGRWGLFDRILTPDHDRAHHNHFHLAILSLHRRRFPPRDTPPEPLPD